MAKSMSYFSHFVNFSYNAKDNIAGSPLQQSIYISSIYDNELLFAAFKCLPSKYRYSFDFITAWSTEKIHHADIYL